MHSRKERIMAWIGIACLLMLYIVSFILGVSGSRRAFPMFIASLLATFFIPTMIYVFQLVLRNARDRRITGKEEAVDGETEEPGEDGANSSG